MPNMTDVTEKLQSLTAQGRATWKTTTVPETFAVTFGPFTLRLSAHPKPSDPRVTYKLSFFDEQNRELDSISYPSAPNHPDHQAPQLPELHHAAKTQALDVPKRLQELIDSIDRITPN